MAQADFSFGEHPQEEEQDRRDLDHLFSVTYEELRRLAAMVRRGRPGVTLSPTTIVNEAWLKLSKTPEIAGTSPLHFKRIAARAMRQVLISAARKRTADKRQGEHDQFVTLSDIAGDVLYRDRQLVALDAALDELAHMNARQAQMVESRFFGGFEIPEIAELLHVSEATVLRDWRAAKAWLASRLEVAAGE